MTIYQRDLMRRSLRGDPSALTEFTHLATPIIQQQVTWVFRRYRSASSCDEVPEVIQMVFEDLLTRNKRRMRQWDPKRGSLTTFLRQVSRSRTLDYLRKYSRTDTPTGELPPLADPGPSTEDALAAKLLIQSALAEVEKDLSAKGRTLLERLVVQDLSAKDLVYETGMSRFNLAQWKSRLRKRLRHAIKAKLRDDEPPSDLRVGRESRSQSVSQPRFGG